MLILKRNPNILVFCYKVSKQINISLFIFSSINTVFSKCIKLSSLGRTNYAELYIDICVDRFVREMFSQYISILVSIIYSKTCFMLSYIIHNLHVPMFIIDIVASQYGDAVKKKSK